MILMIISFSFYSYIAHLALDGYTFQGSNIRVSFANPSKSTQVHLLILVPLSITRIKILKVCFLLERYIIPKAGFFSLTSSVMESRQHKAILERGEFQVSLFVDSCLSIIFPSFLCFF